MYHYKTSKRAVDTLYEYNKFTKDYNTFLTSLKDDSSASLDFKRNKYLLDQLAEDLNRSFNRVKADVFNKKITNTKNKLEDVKVEFMKGMLNDGFSVK